MTITKKSLIRTIKMMMEQDLALLEAKNSDYAGEDALSNFRRHGVHGINVRIYDKYERAENLENKEPENESKEDTYRDMGGYSYIARVMLREKMSKQPTHCSNCGKEYKVGDTIYYILGTPVCYECKHGKEEVGNENT